MSTFSQIYIHIVFAVKGRECLINETWEKHLYKYITGIVQNKGQKMLAINGVPDHIHMLIGIKPSCSISDLVREIKKSSDQYIKDKNFTKYIFNWQEGFGSFSCGQSQLDSVIAYINNQKEHHRKKSFKEEYVEFLKKYNIEYNNKFVFDLD